MVSNYDKIVADQDIKLRFLELQRLDVEKAHKKQVEERNKEIAAIRESEVELKKKLEAEAERHA